MNFENPGLLWLLAIPLLLVGLYVWRELAERRPHLRVSTAVPSSMRSVCTSFMRLIRVARSVVSGHCV